MFRNVTEHSDEPVDEDVRVHRGVNRATYELDTVQQIIDSSLVAHVGTVRDGSPVVIPMFCALDDTGEHLLLHGAPASGVIRRGRGADVCVTITHVDGLVLARSAFHHSLNYRCAMILGEAVEIDDPEEKAAALDRFVEAMAPGRVPALRPTTVKESRGTSVLRIPIARSSVKIRTGDPVDDDEDYELPIWAGIVPITSTFGEPVGDARVLDGVEAPHHVIELVGHVV